jgi:hypothetical protein
MQNQSTSARTAAKYGSKSPLLFRQATILAILMLAAGLFVGCSTENSNADKKRMETLSSSTCETGFCIAIMVYDSCEYLVSGYGYSQMMTHKGNCKYCLTRKK